MSSEPNTQFIGLRDNLGVLWHRHGAASWFRAQQFLGVGVSRVGKQTNAVGQFNNLAKIHNRDGVAYVLHHAKIMID